MSSDMRSVPDPKITNIMQLVQIRYWKHSWFSETIWSHYSRRYQLHILDMTTGIATIASVKSLANLSLLHAKQTSSRPYSFQSCSRGVYNREALAGDKLKVDIKQVSCCHVISDIQLSIIQAMTFRPKCFSVKLLTREE